MKYVVITAETDFSRPFRKMLRIVAQLLGLKEVAYLTKVPDSGGTPLNAWTVSDKPISRAVAQGLYNEVDRANYDAGVELPDWGEGFCSRSCSHVTKAEEPFPEANGYWR